MRPPSRWSARGATASTAWAIQPTPNPQIKQGFLFTPSCTAADACIAVGYSTDSSSVEVTLAEAWNGTSWSIQPTPNPSGAIGSGLEGVSCTSAEACIAVGYSANSSGVEMTLAEAWNGTSWSIQPTPNPAGAFLSSLYGVSCASAEACIAVGDYGASSGAELTLVEAWNGRSWQIQKTAEIPGAVESYLGSVSCTSADACTAVGAYVNKSFAELALAEVWNGTSWSVHQPRNPSGTAFSYLNGVSCTSAAACTAVGAYAGQDSNQSALAEAWNGTSWSIQLLLVPSSTTGSSLDDDSCSSADACTAVGSYENSSGVALTLAEAWNGTSWSFQPSPNPSRATESVLLGVSCTSANACTAVGGYDSLALAEAWNGTSWSIQKAVNLSGAASSYLDGVSCTSADACTGVGSYEDSYDVGLTLAEAWNGTSWSVQRTRNPSGALESGLSGVSCTAPDACTAVGDYESRSGVETLAEAWNGTSWSIQKTPNPSGAVLSGLFGVSCTSADACTAVGAYVGSSGDEPTLVEAWNGTSWSIQPSPSPSSAIGGVLEGVSCTSTDACTAVGAYFENSGAEATLVEAWNGTSWSIQPSPSPPIDSILDGVSCTAADACTAVGDYENRSGVRTLAEAWNGTSWSIHKTPNPLGAFESGLFGVSCTADVCTAVGGYVGSSGAEVTLAEAWNGTSWSVQPTPNPAGAALSELGGVSCTAAGACIAVGATDNLTLAEAEA
jgi:hypothetical protein